MTRGLPQAPVSGISWKWREPGIALLFFVARVAPTQTPALEIRRWQGVCVDDLLRSSDLKEGGLIPVETERARWRGEEPYSRTATTPDGGLAKGSAKSAQGPAKISSKGGQGTRSYWAA